MFSSLVLAALLPWIEARPQPRQVSGPNGLLPYGRNKYTCPAEFPYAIYEDYYTTPASQQPQPKIPIPESMGQYYPYNLTDPDNIPLNNTVDPVFYPVVVPSLASQNITSAAAAQSRIADIISGAVQISNASGLSSNCTKCIASLGVAAELARTTPMDVPTLLINLCTQYNFSSASSCKTTYSAAGSGAVLSQVLAYANISNRDGQYICQKFVSVCPKPAPLTLDLSQYVTSPKPANASAPAASGKRIKVLHLSDFHLDPRYKNGAEANCSSGLCCRSNVNNKASPNKVLLPAPKYGSFLCDTPYELALSALQAIPAVGSPNGKPDFNFTLYTGDLVSHDPNNQLSREYVEETETAVYDLFRRFFGTGPIYAALGNHDTYQVAFDAPNVLPGNLSTKGFSWNYDHVSTLWQSEGWLNSTISASAKTHYGAYSVRVPGHNLRIITINTDFWYQTNYFNYINMTNPDLSGSLKFMADELAGAERRGERVWIVGHVLSGWSGTNPLPDPTSLFYAIVSRYAPGTIANIFFGHTHEDQFSVFYSGNGSVQTLNNAVANAWIGPSVTPLTNLNSGFRFYEVDTGNYNVYESFTYYSNVSTYAEVQNKSKGVTYQYEYSARQAYDMDKSWPKDAPLNGTFWHYATEQMIKYPQLMVDFTRYQGKTSVKTLNPCNSTACLNAKICYMRSGSGFLGSQCPSGFDSVQGS